MSEDQIFPVFPTVSQTSWCDTPTYEALYRQALEHPEEFWARHADRLDWIERWHTVRNASFHGDAKIRWFEGGKLNVSANCLDRHLARRRDQMAILWEPNDLREPSRCISYGELYREVCRCSNLLKRHGVKSGDRVTIYLPMIPQAAVAMLACTRIGAIHSVVFAGFSAESLAERIRDCKSEWLFTADQGRRGDKFIELKRNADKALEQCPNIKKIFVVRHTRTPVPWNEKRDVDYFPAIARERDECEPTPMDAEAPLFILYTSGSTAKPKGVLHTTGGYLLYAAMTHQYVFDYREGEVFWCTADVGWVTGHSYVVYGPLANGATTLMFEGIPTYPTPARFWETIDRHGVAIFYTAPTAIRALMREGDHHVSKTSRKSLRILGTVGEPINPEAWLWYFRNVGGGLCPVVDTWWQTETGGILISPLPGATPLKPGSATKPFFGIEPAIVDDQGIELSGECSGHLVIKQSWPGQMRTVFGDHARFINTYFKRYPGMYFTGDGCRRDKDGYYWITGRVDDVLNVSGHRLGTAEIESALVAHKTVAEAAVVGRSDPIKGQSIYAYVTLKMGIEATDALRQELIAWVAKEIGGIAKPDAIQWAHALPKTRSGKIMRRILRKIAQGDVSDFGDTSTLAEPGVIEELVKERR